MAHTKHRFKEFISKPIMVHFSSPPTHSKKPHCPDQFSWQDQDWHIKTCLSESKDFTRRGRMGMNMQPQHALVASKRGSWGVGRFYFDVETDNGRCFRLYYDRAPANATDRKGQWVLLAELKQTEV